MYSALSIGVQRGEGKGDSPPQSDFSKTKKFLFKTSVYGLKYYKIAKKWCENTSREVQKYKIFLPRGRGHPFLWTPSPAALALRASARIIGPSGQIRNFVPPKKKIGFSPEGGGGIWEFGLKDP